MLDSLVHVSRRVESVKLLVEACNDLGLGPRPLDWHRAQVTRRPRKDTHTYIGFVYCLCIVMCYAVILVLLFYVCTYVLYVLLFEDTHT